jgi:hypothetical protein
MIQYEKSIFSLLILLFTFQIISCKNVSTIENKIENIEDLIQKLKKIEHVRIQEDSVLNFKSLTIKDTTDKKIVEYWLIPSKVFENQKDNEKFTKRLTVSSCMVDKNFRQFTWKDITFYPYCGSPIENEQSILIFNAFESELILNGAKLKLEYTIPNEIEKLSESKKSKY